MFMFFTKVEGTFMMHPKNDNQLILLEPLLNARKKRGSNSPLQKVLEGDSTIAMEKKERLKRLLKFGINRIKNFESIFSQSRRVKTETNPDGVIDDLLAEVEAALYLHIKGFKNIIYNQKKIDFTAKFENKMHPVEAAHLRGPNFKNQKIISEQDIPVYDLDPENFIKKIKNKYDSKEKQLSKYGYNNSNSIIFLRTSRLESHEPWFQNGASKNHPIDDFVQTRPIPTVILGGGTIYEPENELFSKLKPFDWNKFINIDD